jgi:2-keto-4-pentenoate hydratase/2-oxohepta-3-ene-1,7-dioic acid hydratase in catechol pathway
MKIVRYDHGGRQQYGELKGDRITPLDGEFPNFKPTPGAKAVALSAVKLLAPTQPSKIVAIGPNYHAHLKGGATQPPRPYYWIKPASAVLNPEEDIRIPGDAPSVCHESELAIVIGRKACRVSAAEGKSYILGYTCVNDVTAGMMHEPEKHFKSQYAIDGKICDTFAPLGPCIVTDLDPSDVQIQCRVNGETRQNHRTSDMYWPPATVVSLISHVVTLMPGDVIATGSPPGAAPFKAGDKIEVEVQGIGVLRNGAIGG